MFVGSGINISQDGSLTFEEGIFYPEPDAYYLENLLSVLFHRPEAFQNNPLYYTYHGVYKEGDLAIFQEMNLRYDLTMILPGFTENEFNKTAGHFFSLKPESHETYVELSEVLWGEAIFLLQKNNRAGEPEVVRAISAKKGDKVFTPPGYGLVLINPGEDTLVIARLVSTKADFLNEPFAQKQGAAYFYIKCESQKADFVKNPQYSQSASLELLGAPSVNLPFEGLREKNLYQAFVDNPKLFSPLK